MKDASRGTDLTHTRSARHGSEPALQVICLASGGGPNEDNVTGFLVRSVSTNWGRNSVLACDAGAHLSAITRLLEPHFPLIADPAEPIQAQGNPNGNGVRKDGAAEMELDQIPSETSSESSPEPPEPPTTTLANGPFAGLPFPHQSARANALHVVRECVSTYLVSHPHIDHMAGFVINTAAFHNTSRPKRLAALPSTVNAIKTHIFNDIIWPNLTDEDGGVGFVTFQRLTSGGNVAVGEGSGKGYIEVCDGLGVKGMKVSHGHCTRAPVVTYSQRSSDVGLSEPSFLEHRASTIETKDQPPSRGISRRDTGFTQPGGPFGPVEPPPSEASAFMESMKREVVVDSTAYFIRDDATGREVLFFGDVEPDSLSLNPRTAQVWIEAAPKIAAGKLKAILIECSYDDSQADHLLFGHLAPRHLVKELAALADMVRIKRAEARERRDSKKRKWRGAGAEMVRGTSGHLSDHSDQLSPTLSRSAEPSEEQYAGFRKRRSFGTVQAMPNSPDVLMEDSAIKPQVSPMEAPRMSIADRKMSVVATASAMGHAASHFVEKEKYDPTIAPLTGVTVIVIHMKDTLKDGPLVDDNILKQLKEHEAKQKEEDGLGLGCEFVTSTIGGSWFF